MEDSGIELNSGVECPGNNSLEPLVGSILTFEEKDFVDEVILVEIAPKDFPFVFKYKA